MTSAPSLPGNRILVVGAARSGLAATALLLGHGYQVTLTDSRPAADLDPKIRQLIEKGGRLEAGGHQATSFRKADLIVVSPGVPSDLAEIRQAREAGVPVWAEAELAWRFLKGSIAGITGSNGKTTTTSLTTHLLREASIDAVACGNIGVPLSSLINEDSSSRWYVFEMSSFQLETIDQLRPHIAVYLNLTQDHLDRHPDFSHYRNAKERIFSNQTSEDHAVLNLDDTLVAAAADHILSRISWFGLALDPRPRFAVERGNFVERSGEAAPRPLLPLTQYALRGSHNISNALASLTTASLCGAQASDLASGLRSFRPLPHRMEPVGALGGIEFVNDSKATNVDAALRAVEAFHQPVVWILGGREKGSDFQPLKTTAGSDRVRGVIAMGEAAERITEVLGNVVPVRKVIDLSSALREACALARSGDVVLLSPACASFDQYRSYEERGDDFRARVRALIEKETGGTASGV
ncbi:MAG: UDP-N-acetylmuramoyl-L-alanine--D-glutamate ligase [Acidobacteriota bacterium]